ncbi:hypothetical protein ACFL2B_01865 [Patescibacteria group bacterium]
MSAFAIVAGIIMIIIGFFLAWKAYAVFKMIGRVDWAERHLSSMGGTYGLIRLIGIAIIIIAFMYMTGLFDYLVVEGLGQLFAGSAK